MEEKHQLLSKPFSECWREMWNLMSNEDQTPQHKTEEALSSKKFHTLMEGVGDTNGRITLGQLIQESNTCWTEPEWEFPKGRKNIKEKDLECALREFGEETGVPVSYVQVIENLCPFEEIFIGSNSKSYKHKYFLAHVDYPLSTAISLQNFQLSEISRVEWKNLEECLSSIRPYHLEKKSLIQNINKVLIEYSLYL